MQEHVSNTATGRKIGLWTSTSLVIGNMIGAGIFMMPSALASYGGIGLLGWLFAAAGAILLAKVFSHLSRMVANAEGGPYAFTREGFGNFAAFIVAWGYWISVWCANAAIAVSFVSALSTFFPVLKTNPVAAVLTGLSAIWFLTWVNTRGVAESGKVQLVTTILKMIPLALVAIAGLFFIRWENFTPFNQSGQSAFSAVTAAAALTLFAFLGLESATIPSGDVENPEKTIPRATMIGTVFTAILYILGSFAILGMIPPEQLKDSVTPYADAAEIIAGPSAKYWISAGVAIAAFGALNGWILVQGQVPAAIAADRLFPAIFARKNRFGAPGFSLVIGNVLVSLLMMMNYTKGLVEQFEFLILLSTMTILVPYLFCSAAYIVLRLERKHLYKGGWVSAILLATAAFLYSLWALGGTGQETVFWGFLLMMAGIPFYVWIRYAYPGSDKT